MKVNNTAGIAANKQVIKIDASTSKLYTTIRVPRSLGLTEDDLQNSQVCKTRSAKAIIQIVLIDIG